MKKIFLVVIFSLILVKVSLFAQDPADKIDPALLVKDGAAEVEVLVSLEKIELTDKAKRIIGKEQKGRFVFEELLQHSKRTQQEVIDSLRSWKVGNVRTFYISNVIMTRIPKSKLPDLAKIAVVRQLSPDSDFYHQPIAENSRDQVDFRAVEWGVSKVRAPEVWNLGYTGQGVVVGGQDTGYEWDHEALKDKYRGWDGIAASHNYNWHDAIHEYDDKHDIPYNPCGLSSAVPCDDNNHGTHTMGTIVGDNGMGRQIGVAPGAKWIGCRNMERGWGKLTTYLECFEWFLAPYAYDEDPGEGDPAMAPHVFANSWGCPPEEGCNTSNFHILNTAVQNLRDAGIIVVVSAGNNGSNCNTIHSPAAIYEGSFTVGATNSEDNIAGFSSRGAVTVDGSGRMKPDISAPGVSVLSSVRGGNLYASSSGTSMAGPHVVGVVALVLSANPGLAGNPDAVEEILKLTAVPRTTTQNCDGSGTQVPNNVYGYGIIDALAAVQMAEDLLPVTWLDFQALDRLMSVELNWKTGTELNSDYFIVERSHNELRWDSIGYISASGFSAFEVAYQFVDKAPIDGIVYYRLKQVDYSGEYQYSVIRSVNRKSPDIRIEIAPNPVIDYVIVKSYAHDGELEFNLYDLLGRTISTNRLESDSPVSVRIPKGAFIYHITDKRGLILKSGKLLGK